MYSHPYSSSALPSLIPVSSVDCQTPSTVLPHYTERILVYNFPLFSAGPKWCQVLHRHVLPGLFLLLWPGMAIRLLDLSKSCHSLRSKSNSSDAILHKSQSFPSLSSFGTFCECHFDNQSHGTLRIAAVHVWVTFLTNQSYTYWA